MTWQDASHQSVFPESNPLSLIHLQVSYGCFAFSPPTIPLSKFPLFCVAEIAFSWIPVPRYLSHSLLKSLAAQSCREIRLEAGKHDIHSTGMHVYPQATAPRLSWVWWFKTCMGEKTKGEAYAVSSTEAWEMLLSVSSWTGRTGCYSKSIMIWSPWWAAVMKRSSWSDSVDFCLLDAAVCSNTVFLQVI